VCTATPSSQGQAHGAETALEFVIDNAGSSPDAEVGDGQCLTADGACTLRAALEEANATPAEQTVRISVADGFEATMTVANNPLDYMTNQPASAEATAGAYFHITRSMTVDLGNRLHISPLAGGSTNLSAAFLVDAPNVQLLNFKDVYSNHTSVVFGPDSDGSVLAGGSAINQNVYLARSMVEVLPGANDITIRDFSMGRFTPANGMGMIHISAYSGGGAVTAGRVQNLAIKSVTFTNAPPSGGSATCSSTSQSGCSATAIELGSNARIDGFTVADSTFDYFRAGSSAINARNGASGSNWDIRDNTFTRISTGKEVADATIAWPLRQRFDGTNYIRRNLFDNAGTHAGPAQQDNAIYVPGDASGTMASHLFIEDNEFNGYLAQSILLDRTGTTTVRRNTFGTDSASQATTANEETIGGQHDVGTLLTNWTQASNRKVLTWKPTNAIILGCQLNATVEPRTQSEVSKEQNLAVLPVTLDFYWTNYRTAEEYLGSVQITTGAAQTVVVPYLPQKTGGQLRLQTQGSSPANQPESSQYSRTVGVRGTAGASCATPSMTIDLRAWRNVAAGASSYESIQATGTEVPSGSVVTASEPVWFTYAVTNTSAVLLIDVTVRDSYANPVCVIPRIRQGTTATCWSRRA
jgi:adhesin/invasin